MPPPSSSTSLNRTKLDKKLAEEVSHGGFNLEPMERGIQSALSDSRIRYQIDYEAFVRSGIDPARRMVQHGPVTRMPLGQLLQEILDQVPARYRTQGDILMIRPRP